ncbi:MAG: AMP-binding protein [Bacteroidales bacterium]|nr:AMP-binding protein [Bacteroidales bacterium]
MLRRIKDSIITNEKRKALIIKDQDYNYHDFARIITGIRQILRQYKNIQNKIVGLVTDDCIETYAAIYAIWFEGLTFVPLNHRFPVSRNLEIIRQSGMNTILYAVPELPAELSKAAENLAPVQGIISDQVDLDFHPGADDDILYILFTSGTTGIPKGVPVSRQNLDAFITAFLKNDYDWHAGDRFLQMFDFTFDVSVQCYTVPLLLGACICTVPHDQIKYLAVYKVLEKHQPTVAVMVPSVIAFLRPYIKNIHLPGVRYTIFTGEAVPLSLVEEWSGCCPDSVIDDCYGPTEATIFCLSYRWNKEKGLKKSYNDVVSIGKPFNGLLAIVVDENDKPVQPGVKGELLIAGDQVIKGYLNNAEKDSTAFITMTVKDSERRFYWTGDLVFTDDEGDFMYCGRLDNQVQVHGFRVELGEIEFQAGKVAPETNCIAVARTNTSGNTEIYMFVEKNEDKIQMITEHLQSALPYYMQPLKLISVDAIPLNDNGKTDRNKLMSMIV